MFLRLPDCVSLYCEGEVSSSVACGDARVTFELSDSLAVKLTATDSYPKFVRLRWNFTDSERRTDVKVLGDAFERGYGDLSWRSISCERIMPWYILVSNGSDLDRDVNGRFTEGFGVKDNPLPS